MLREQPPGVASLALCGRERGMSGTAGSRGHVRETPPVRLYHEVLSPEFRVTLVAVPHIVALIAGLRVVERLDGMDLPEIRAMRLGNVVRPVVRDAQVSIDAAAFMAIKAELLVMAVRAVPARTTGEEAVLTHLIGPVGRRNA